MKQRYSNLELMTWTIFWAVVSYIIGVFVSSQLLENKMKFENHRARCECYPVNDSLGRVEGIESKVWFIDKGKK